MAGVVADSSVLLEYLARRPVELFDDAVESETLVVPPLVVAEVISGHMSPEQRTILGEVLQGSPVHVTNLGHWIDVGLLRRDLRRRGLTVTLPDAHVAQCALDLDALLLTRDAIFTEIARHTTLRITSATS